LATANASSTTVTVTASTAGSAGNSIALSEGLTGFSWNGTTLLNGTEGTNSGTSFGTSTDTTTEAANFVAAINRTSATSTVVTASNSGATVTITANTAGSAGNSIALGDSLSTFAWTGGATALSGGADGQASIVALNQLYSGAAVAASDTGTFSANTISGGQSVTITNPNLSAGPNNPLVLTASNPVAASQTGTFTGNVRNSGTAV